jgi:hypothetical protein
VLNKIEFVLAANYLIPNWYRYNYESKSHLIILHIGWILNKDKNDDFSLSGAQERNKLILPQNKFEENPRNQSTSKSVKTSTTEEGDILAASSSLVESINEFVSVGGNEGVEARLFDGGGEGFDKDIIQDTMYRDVR